MEPSEVLAMVGGHVDEELLLRNEYLAAENEILKSKIERPVLLTNPERIRLAKISKGLGRKGLEGVPCIVKPDTHLRWYRDLVARKFDGSEQRRGPGRPRITSEIEELVVRFAEENPDWGYDRIQGALANLGHVICDETVGNILRRNGIPPAPERGKNTTWTDFVHAHKDSMAGMDFFTTEMILHCVLRRPCDSRNDPMDVLVTRGLADVRGVDLGASQTSFAPQTGTANNMMPNHAPRRKIGIGMKIGQQALDTWPS